MDPTGAYRRLSTKDTKATTPLHAIPKEVFQQIQKRQEAKGKADTSLPKLDLSKIPKDVLLQIKQQHQDKKRREATTNNPQNSNNPLNK